MTNFEKNLLEVFDFAIENLDDISTVYDMAAASVCTASMVVIGHDSIVSSGMDLAERALRDNTARLNALRSKLVDVQGRYREAFERIAAKKEAAEHEE